MTEPWFAPKDIFFSRELDMLHAQMRTPVRYLDKAMLALYYQEKLRVLVEQAAV